MTAERTPSEQRLRLLRAHVVRFQIQAEKAGLWPGALANRNRYREAIAAARELLYLFRRAKEVADATREARLASRVETPPRDTGWSRFWFAGINKVVWSLYREIEDLALHWLILPTVDWDNLPTEVRGDSLVHILPRVDVEGQVANALADKDWQSHFVFLVEPTNADLESRLRRQCGDHLDEWRVSGQFVSEIARCIRLLDDVLTQGVLDVGPDCGEEVDLEMEVEDKRPGRKPNCPQLVEFVVSLAEANRSWPEIAEEVNRLGRYAPHNADSVRAIYRRAVRTKPGRANATGQNRIQ